MGAAAARCKAQTQADVAAAVGGNYDYKVRCTMRDAYTCAAVALWWTSSRITPGAAVERRIRGLCGTV
eukprot:5540071-Alexandrium_andersonii.AAC.1